MTDTQIAASMAALGHTIRLQVWRMLLPHGNQGLPAGDIAARMSILPSSLSFHLRQMTQAGVLSQRRSSRQLFYTVNLDIRRLVHELIGPNRESDGVALSDAAADGVTTAALPCQSSRIASSATDKASAHNS
jgi:DNA-binding transcriptional ArsR family regulator